jgi:hypothetical protein
MGEETRSIVTMEYCLYEPIMDSSCILVWVILTNDNVNYVIHESSLKTSVPLRISSTLQPLRVLLA